MRLREYSHDIPLFYRWAGVPDLAYFDERETLILSCFIDERESLTLRFVWAWDFDLVYFDEGDPDIQLFYRWAGDLDIAFLWAGDPGY